MEKEVLLESTYIELDPVLQGFEGVLVEITRHDEDYVLTQTAAGSGNRIFRFTSSNDALVYELFHDFAFT